MTLDECFTANQGKPLLIPGGGAGNEGQCVQWADTVLHDVYNKPYHWGNAIDWWNNPGELLNDFDKITDGSIKKGDIVVFNTQVGSKYGHIDVAMSDGTTSNFRGADSNWGGDKTVHIVQHANPNLILGSLRLKGEDMTEKINDDDLFNISNAGQWPRDDGLKDWDWKRFWYDYAANKVQAMNAEIADLQHKVNVVQASNGDATRWQTLKTLLKELIS